MARGRYVANEDDVVLGTVKSWTGQQPTGVVFCHGSGDTVVQPFRDQVSLLYGLARQATVHLGDLGYETFCNDLAITRVGQAIAHLRSSWGVVGPVALVGMSMGAGNALTYALHHPEDVACVAGVIPLTDLVDAMTRIDPAGINAAYGGAYNDAIHGPTHNPIRFAADLPADMPIHLWSAGSDPFTPASVTQAFVTARPQTGFTDVGAWGHTDAAVSAAASGIVQFVRAHT